MRVLVTGATGLIGSALCDALLARGDEVVGLTRDPDRARPKNPTVHWHAWQATTERPPPEALAGVDGVVNLIGEEINQRLTDQAKVRIRESRLVSTRNLLQGIEAAPSQAEGLHRPVRDRLLRRPRRQDPRRGVPARRRLHRRDPDRLGDGRARGGGDRPACRHLPHRTGHLQARRPPQAAPSPVQARRRRPDRRRRAVHVLDTHRRRGRPAALGAGQRPGQRHRSTRPRPTR